MREYLISRVAVAVAAGAFGLWLAGNVSPMYRGIADAMTAVAAPVASVGKLTCIGGQIGNAPCLLQRD